MSTLYTYKFRVKNLDPKAKTIARKEIEVKEKSHAHACDLMDEKTFGTYWHPDAFLESNDPNAPKGRNQQ